jgi:hypothetical protein
LNPDEPGTKTVSPIRPTRAVAGVDDPSHRFVAGNERVSHPWKRGHPSRPQKPLRAGADPAPVDFDQQVVICQILQVKRSHGQTFGFFDDDGERFHCSLR